MTLTQHFDYRLPAERIAQEPAEPRDSARLLVDRGPDRSPDHRTVADLPSLMGPGDLLVVNRTRVLPARLTARKVSGGRVEVLLLERRGRSDWEALVRPSRRVAAGTTLHAGPGRLVVGEDLGAGRRRVQVEPEVVEAAGEVPLPPYLHRPLAAPDRYQTVYARADASSAAAPTAGLHLTTELLQRCRAAGAEVAAVDLDIGLGTFRPITAERVEDHPMHAERYRVDPSVLTACRDAGRVVAVGTTVVRALESAAATGAPEGRTDLFIRPGFKFGVVDALLTNFHAPRSSLLVLVEAFIGPRWRDLYDFAGVAGYRFLSLGDAMFLERR